jgi:hypothetical protein
MNCPIIFKRSKSTVILKNKNVRIMVGAKPRNSHRGLCERLDTVPLLHEYSLMTFVINKFFKKSQRYMVLILRINAIFTDRCQTSMFPRKCVVFYHSRLTESDKTKDKM